MEYHIALSPELGLSSADFVAAWNADPECHLAAQARLDQPAGAQYDPSILIDSGLTTLATIAAGISAAALYDLIKQILIKKGIRKTTEFLQLKQPDGSHLIVTKIVED